MYSYISKLDDYGATLNPQTIMVDMDDMVQVKRVQKRLVMMRIVE
ncbi:hypothetical protein [Clostridium sp.]